MEESLHQEYLEQSALEADELVQFPCEEAAQKPVYFLKCTHFWPEFCETASFPYCVNHVCDYQKPLDAKTQEQADLSADLPAACACLAQCKTRSDIDCV